jgi:uncharacterized protein
MPEISSLSVTLVVGLVTVASLYLTLTLVTAHLFTTAARHTVPPTPPASSFTRIPISSRHDRLALAGWYRAAPAARGAVILVHGRDACRGNELRGSTFPLAEHLHGLGLSVVMLDLRGHGDSARARVTFGRNERHDILGALDFLLAHGYQPGTIGLLGASMGGAGAIAAAAEDAAIGALIADSSFADLHTLLRRRFTRLTRMPRFMLRGSLAAARMLTGVDLVSQSPVADMERLQGRPTLVIHAANDPFVPVSDARALAIAGATQLWITDSDRHLGSFSHSRTEYMRVITAFFDRHLPRATHTRVTESLKTNVSARRAATTHHARATETAPVSVAV